jgi:hypothetical protein
MPQNEGYYYAAYAIVAATYVLYAVSLWRRGRAQRSRGRDAA